MKAGKAIPVCPEQLGGLRTPRPPCEIQNGRVVDAEGHDMTEAFLKGAKATLAIAQKYEAEEARFKSRSPSCGSGWIYDGSFSQTLTLGDGVTAKLLKENGIHVKDTD